MAEYTKPLPKITPLDRPYWDSCKRHAIALQRCDRCRAFRNPPSPLCPDCGAAEYTWTPVSGKGRVVSWVVFHQLYFPSFADDLPYNVVMARLDEGPLMVANMIGIDNTDIRKDMRVEVVYDDVTGEVTIPRFRPLDG